MLRVVLAATWVWAVLAGSASARASAPVLACTCADQAALFASVSAAEAANAPALAVGAADVFEAALPLSDEGPLAWCSSPDDPRCSSRDAGSSSDQRDLRSPLRAVARLELATPSVGTELSGLRPVSIGAPRSGELQRVERPPRS